VTQDWATEAQTCGELDRAGMPNDAESSGAHPMLRRSHWNSRLFFGATETAAHGACHMEGALDSAARIARSLAATNRTAPDNQAHGEVTTEVGNKPDDNDLKAAQALFAAWVARERVAAPEHYRVHLTRLLATQQHERMTQRAVVAVAEQVYSQALAQLDRLMPTPLPDAGLMQGRSAWTPGVLATFSGWSKALLDGALEFNRASCAISNFPDDHDPSPEAVQAIGRDLLAAWREFAWQVNDLLVARQAGARIFHRQQEQAT